MTRYLITALLLFMSFFSFNPIAHSADLVNYYVSVDGNDAWSGNLAEPNALQTDGPFATLDHARDAIRPLEEASNLPASGVNVIVREGDYFLEKTFELSAKDSGMEASPVTYSAYPGETVRLIGGTKVSGFKPVTDSAILKKLDAKARGNVLQADLKVLGITDYGSAKGGGTELFFNGKSMQIARWPNTDFTRIVDIVVDDGHEIHGRKGSKVGKFQYDGDRPSRWINEKDPWLHGYWFWDWSDQRMAIESIDTANNTITLAEPAHNYGYRKGQWYYAYNMLSELDSPGEWYIDRDEGILYFWPPEPIQQSSTQAILSVLPSLISLDSVSHVTIKGFELLASRGTAIVMNGGEQNLVDNCTIYNTGGSAVHVSGLGHGVVNCEIYQTGDGGISLNGGDRATITPAGLYADNNHIHHYGRINRMYTPAIGITGVGNRATHNLIHTAPHMAIMFSGNEHLMEYNEIHDVCLESNDAGAIYAGRNWTMRGHRIHYNYLYDITGFEDDGCVGVYLDDMFASASIYGNVFHNVTRAAFIGGGRDCLVENNIFIDCDKALHIDARALNWAAYHADDWITEANEKKTLLGIKYNKPPYSERYPQLITILNDEPKAPVGNVVTRNIFLGDNWDDITKVARPYIKVENNMINEDPLFIDREGKDFRLDQNSPAYKIGFAEIPFDLIGLRKE